MNVLPIEIRRLRARMEMKDLSLKKLSEAANVPYATCSQILNGRLIHPEYLRRIKAAIRKSPLPSEAVA